MVDLVTAIRVDDHSRLGDLNISPRAALVFKPTEHQNFRLTYNRAFGTPTTNNLFLDLTAARLPPPINFYAVQARGVPSTATPSTTCVRAGSCPTACALRWHPGSCPPTRRSSGTTLLDLLAQLAPEFAPIVQFLQMPGAIPTDPAIGTVFKRLDINTQEFVPDDGPTRVDPLESTIHTTIEGGYKGLLGGRVLLSADVYKANIQNFVGPLRVETPNVFLDEASTRAFVFYRLAPLIQAGVITEAQATQIVGTLAQVPIGTVVPDQSEDHNLMVTYRELR